MYATKRRRRNVKNYKHPPKESQKSNPSKRHRERLNAELENLASLLPFEQNILTKLDKLSILRLAVSYLRIKSYFQATLKNSLIFPQIQHERDSSISQIRYLEPNFSEGNSILESLNGFILIVNTNSEVFYASRTVEQYIGFHQSDIIHQSVFELIHSEDREEFKKHLQWNSKLPAEKSNLTLNEVISNKEYSKYLERNFTVRFRCLLDNTSGFLTLDIVGRLNVLHGQRAAFQVNSNGEIINPQAKTYNKGKNSKIPPNNDATSQNLNDTNNTNNNQEPILALFAIACPFGPPSLFELPQRDSLFKTKHKINFEPISIDAKGKLILGYSDNEFNQTGGYDLIHPDDLKYYANAHKELLKTGSCGLICYRLLTLNKNWQWLQSSMRIIYKSNKPECIIANHRPLTNDEGEELYYKRGTEYKLPYPCLYDFESNFGSVLNNYSDIASNNKNFNQQQSESAKSNQTSSQSNKSTAKSSTISNTANNSAQSGTKTKSSKYNKSQLIQQRAQQHAQQQLNIQQNNYSNYQLNDNQTYKFNSNYMNTHLNQPNQQNLDYYSPHPCKTELIDETIYDAKSNQITSDYSSLPSSSSASSTSSISSTSSSSDSISINISNPNYHYNYFNGLNSYYNYPLNDANKFYSSTSYSNGLFYPHNSNNSNNYNNYSNQHYLNTNTENQSAMLLHSNNSSCSSNSSSCSSNGNCVEGYNNGLTGVAGVLWPETVAPSNENEYNHSIHHLSHSYSSNDPQAQVNLQPGAVYNDLLNCANANVAAMAAAKYTCAAAATYCPYPFSAVDDYQSPVSQIQL